MSRDMPEMSNQDAELFSSPQDARTAHYLEEQIEKKLEEQALRDKETIRRHDEEVVKPRALRQEIATLEARVQSLEHQRDVAQRQRDEWSAAFDKVERQKDKLLDLLALWLEHELSYSSIAFDELVQKTQDTIDELKEGKNE